LSKAMSGAGVFRCCPIWVSTICPPIGECGCTLWHSPWSHTPPPSPHADSHMLLLALPQGAQQFASLMCPGLNLTASN
jgi:hypothetical protein